MFTTIVVLSKVITAVKSLLPAKETTKWPVRNLAESKNFSSARKIVAANEEAATHGLLQFKRRLTRIKGVNAVKIRKRTP